MDDIPKFLHDILKVATLILQQKNAHFEENCQMNKIDNKKQKTEPAKVSGQGVLLTPGAVRVGPGAVRVGRCTYDNKTGKRTDPACTGFTSVLVMMKSHSEWGVIGPYCLKDSKGRIFENIWQFSKCYEKVPKSRQEYSRYDHTVIWDHPAETHINFDGSLTPEYFAWRKKGMESKYPIRYPVGFGNQHKCLYALAEKTETEFAPHFVNPYECLDYIPARKHIYLKEYVRLVREHPKFLQLKDRLANGENLLIIEVDGPRQESLDYYVKTYGVPQNFIEQGSTAATKDNLNVFLNDPKHPFGHGFCLGAALLDIELTF